MAESDGLSEKAKIILGQFPGPVTLYPWKLKLTFAFVVFPLVAALGAWGLFWDEFEPPIGMNWHTFGGAFLILVGGLGAVVSGIALGTNFYVLTLDAMGFEFPVMWKRVRRSWGDADRFTTIMVPVWAPMQYAVPIRIFNLNLVAFDDATCSAGFWSAAARAIDGRNRRLPDTYGVGAENLARLMTAWRERALAQSR